jgi:hypothetical protein
MAPTRKGNAAAETAERTHDKDEAEVTTMKSEGEGGLLYHDQNKHEYR